MQLHRVKGQQNFLSINKYIGVILDQFESNTSPKHLLNMKNMKSDMVDFYRSKEAKFYQVYADTKVPNKYPVKFFTAQIIIFKQLLTL